jgi:hypothetical protein
MVNLKPDMSICFMALYFLYLYLNFFPVINLINLNS